MKPASAKELPFNRYIDSQGIQRKEWHLKCESCGNTWKTRAPKYKAMKLKLCRSCKAKNMPQKVREKIRNTLIKKYKTDEDFKRRVAEAQKVKSGENHWNWKGGVTPITQKTRTSPDARAWRLAVFYRDNFTCRICNSKEKLQAHHINSWVNFPEDRFILENGITLCKTCHDLYHQFEREFNKNGKRNNTCLS